MNNDKMPPVQPMQQVNLPAGATPGMPMIQQVQLAPPKQKDVAGLVKTIAIIILSLIAATFIGLFVWVFLQYDEEKTDQEEKIAVAVASAQDEQRQQDQATCQEEKDYPYQVFAGPVDYGELNFEYPKTWSVYIAADAAKGGEFTAYLNPLEIGPISNDSPVALRVRIVNNSFESVSATYQNAVKDKKNILNVMSITINNEQTTADLYYGAIPGTELSGYIVIFKIRDKTAILQSDSVVFKEDFEKLLGTITFNS